MILADANLLLYAYNSSAPEHAPAKSWLEEKLSRPEPFALCWATLGAFLRLATHRAIFPAPYSIVEATRIVDSWLARTTRRTRRRTRRRQSSSRSWRCFQRRRSSSRS